MGYRPITQAPDWKILMRRLLIRAAALLALLVNVLWLNAEPPPALINPVGADTATAAATDDPQTEQVLQQLDQVGQGLREFTAKLKLAETDNALGTSTVRSGNVYFQRRRDGSARIHVVFDFRIDEERQRAFPEKVEYLLDGPWLIDRNYKTKNEVKRQVLKPGQKIDLFKLGEGPFPLPIGQSPQDVHKQFDVKRIPPAKDDPANTVHLQLTPRPGTDLARKFHSIDVWVDNKTHMPVRVDTSDVKQQTTRSTEMSSIAVNPQGGLPDSDFQLQNIDNQNWNRHVESLND